MNPLNTIQQMQNQAQQRQQDNRSLLMKLLGSHDIQVNNTTPTVSMSSPSPAPLSTPIMATKPSLTSNRGFVLPKDQEYKLLSNILAEAQAEGTPGMQAVINVIGNRIGTKNLTGGKYKNAFDVISEPHQFSAFSTGNQIYKKYLDVLRGKKTSLTPLEKNNLSQVQNLINQAKTGTLQDLTKGATQYYNPQKANPIWASKLKNMVNIGSHTFGKF